jgi:hypothetical protein
MSKKGETIRLIKLRSVYLPLKNPISPDSI